MPPDRHQRNAGMHAGATRAASLELDPARVARVIRDAARTATVDPAGSLVPPR
jgi:hypothetical protein